MTFENFVTVSLLCGMGLVALVVGLAALKIVPLGPGAAAVALALLVFGTLLPLIYWHLRER